VYQLSDREVAKVKVEVEIEDAYDVEEAAAILKVGVATIWRWVGKGKLSFFKLSGRTLIPATAIKKVEESVSSPGQGSSIGQEEAQ
jgi:excisionase family DNA binding protein